MADFDAVDGALEGFRLTRERPQTLPVWAAFHLVLALATGLLGVALGGEALTEFARSRGRIEPDEMLARLAELAPFFLATFALNVIATALFSAAVFRAVLRPEEGGPGFFRLGADEVRVMVSFLGVLLLVVALVFGVMILLGLLLGLANGVLARVLAVLVTLAPLIGFAFGFTRLMLSLPQTFAERRISVVGGWRLSRRRFWPLFGMIVLAAVLALVVYILALLIYFPLGAILGGGIKGAGAPLQPSFNSVADWFSPAMGAYLLVMAFAASLMNAALVAPLAHAYRALSRAEPEAPPTA